MAKKGINMKSLFAFASWMIVAGVASASKEVKVAAAVKAAAVGQIAEQNLASNKATMLIEKLLDGQSWKKRVSILETVCTQKKSSKDLHQIVL